MSKALFGVAQLKQNKNILLLLLLKEVVNYVNHYSKKISFFKKEPSFKIFTFAMIFQKYGDERLFI